MADLESNFRPLYVKAKSLSDFKGISLAKYACNEPIKVAADDAQLLDKAFAIYRYIYSRSFSNSAPYSWFEKSVKGLTWLRGVNALQNSKCSLIVKKRDFFLVSQKYF